MNAYTYLTCTSCGREWRRHPQQFGLKCNYCQHAVTCRKRGIPVPRRRSVDPLEQFIPVPESGCWLWTGAWHANGYGQVPLGKQNKRMGAHRFFYRHFKGEIPDGMFICHKCDTPACVNPDHLYAGTPLENIQDAWRRGRARPGGKVPRYSRINQEG